MLLFLFAASFRGCCCCSLLTDIIGRRTLRKEARRFPLLSVSSMYKHVFDQRRPSLDLPRSERGTLPYYCIHLHTYFSIALTFCLSARVPKPDQFSSPLHFLRPFTKNSHQLLLFSTLLCILRSRFSNPLLTVIDSRRKPGFIYQPEVATRRFLATQTSQSGKLWDIDSPPFSIVLMCWQRAPFLPCTPS